MQTLFNPCAQLGSDQSVTIRSISTGRWHLCVLGSRQAFFRTLEGRQAGRGLLTASSYCHWGRQQKWKVRLRLGNRLSRHQQGHTSVDTVKRRNPRWKEVCMPFGSGTKNGSKERAQVQSWFVLLMQAKLTHTGQESSQPVDRAHGLRLTTDFSTPYLSHLWPSRCPSLLTRAAAPSFESESWWMLWTLLSKQLRAAEITALVCAWS